MPVFAKIADIKNEMTAWRRDIHAHPEIAFEEERTADMVAKKLASFGIQVHRGLAKTGVVGTLTTGDGPSIGLRADMDALPMQEKNGFAHCSKHPGKMHACGHDGHTAMLLGAAKYLAETKNFSGTVHFIFQPAEEGEGGGRVMVEEGLFDKFPCDAVYGMHNQPMLDVGKFAMRAGPVMAAFDTFEIRVLGKGSHAAAPERGIDPLVVGAEIIMALQTIVSRSLPAMDSAVVSVTQFHGGDAWNVIPDDAVIRGTTRCFENKVRDLFEPSIRRIVEGIAAAHGATVEMNYLRRYPPTVNHVQETAFAAEVAQSLVGTENVLLNPSPLMGGEDFAFMLQARPGCYLWIGNGPGEGGCMLHNPHYDFNDEVLPIGASYWAKLVETALPVA